VRSPLQQAYCAADIFTRRWANLMNKAEKDPDDTFSDLLKFVSFAVIAVFGLGIGYLCA
jgi:hypothetical protein